MKLVCALTFLALSPVAGWWLGKSAARLMTPPSGSLSVADGEADCPDGTRLHGDVNKPIVWACELAEFVPDLPERMHPGLVINTPSSGALFDHGKSSQDDYFLTVNNASAQKDLIVYSGSEALIVNEPSAVNCLYWRGSRVKFLTLDDGKRERVKCSKPDDPRNAP